MSKVVAALLEQRGVPTKSQEMLYFARQGQKPDGHIFASLVQYSPQIAGRVLDELCNIMDRQPHELADVVVMFSHENPEQEDALVDQLLHVFADY